MFLTMTKTNVEKFFSENPIKWLEETEQIMHCLPASFREKIFPDN
jgi:hypothetical protein